MTGLGWCDVCIWKKWFSNRSGPVNMRHGTAIMYSNISHRMQHNTTCLLMSLYYQTLTLQGVYTTGQRGFDLFCIFLKGSKCVLKGFEVFSVLLVHVTQLSEAIIAMLYNLLGPVKRNQIQDVETNQATAVHEAGHALVAYYTQHATAPHKVTILCRGTSLGHVSVYQYRLA